MYMMWKNFKTKIPSFKILYVKLIIRRKQDNQLIRPTYIRTVFSTEMNNVRCSTFRCYIWYIADITVFAAINNTIPWCSIRAVWNITRNKLTYFFCIKHFIEITNDLLTLLSIDRSTLDLLCVDVLCVIVVETKFDQVSM